MKGGRFSKDHRGRRRGSGSSDQLIRQNLCGERCGRGEMTAKDSSKWNISSLHGLTDVIICLNDHIGVFAI